MTFSIINHRQAIYSPFKDTAHIRFKTKIYLTYKMAIIVQRILFKQTKSFLKVLKKMTSAKIDE